MSRIALFFKATQRFEDDNYLRFGNCLSKSHEVSLIPIDSLRLINNDVCGEHLHWQRAFKVGADLPEAGIKPIDQDLLWVLSLGEQRSFLDKYQLLYLLSKKTQIINSLDALMHLKSKYYMASQPKIFPQPETHVSPSSSELAKIIIGQGGKWIVKPPAGSLGRDVFLVNPYDTNINSILEHLAGAEEKNYTMIQRYVPQIEQGEKRVILAGGQVIDQYKRLPGSDHRTNVSQGALIEHCDLNKEEREYCEYLAQHLLAEGVYFSAIDLAWPWIIEVNVVNPGGIITLENLTGEDRTNAVLNAVLEGL